MFDPFYRLHNLIFEYESEIEDIAFLFDRLDIAAKVDAVNSLKGMRLFQVLWDKAATAAPLEVDDLVPNTVKPMEPVVFHCKSSQRAFPEYNLVMCRPPVVTGQASLWGYSETYVKSLIGPGYYVVHNSLVSDHGLVACDYSMVPPEAPAGWPRIRPNNIGFGRRVYDGLVAYLRRVGEDVFVGAHTKDEHETGAYFAAVRLL